jgi:hypothetical protein
MRAGSYARGSGMVRSGLGIDCGRMPRPSCLPALSGTVLLASLLGGGCRTPPPPEIPSYAGEAKIGSVTRPSLPRKVLPLRQAHALLSEPEPSHGSFGQAVACWGSTVVVGAPRAGASGKVWIYDAEHLEKPAICLLPPPGSSKERFGSAVAISPTGDRIAVGSPNATIAGVRELGRVDLWRRDGDAWVHERAFTDPDTSSEFQHFGASVALDGECLIAGAPDASMTVTDAVLKTKFRRERPDPGAPMPTEAPEPIFETVEEPSIRQHFIREGAVLVWQRDKAGAWEGPEYCFLTRGRPMARFGTAIAHDGNQTVVSAPPQMTKYGVEGGTISVFIRRPDAPWRPEANAIIAPEEAEASDLFGTAIATAPGLAVSGIPNANTPLAVDAGRVLVFQQNVATRLWIESAPLESPAPEVGSSFGKAVAVWGEQVVVGQPTATRANGSGTVFAFEKRSGVTPADETQLDEMDDLALRKRLGRAAPRGQTWEATEEWAAPAIARTENFGQSVATSTTWAVVGAPAQKGQKSHVILYRKSSPIYREAAPAAPPASSAIPAQPSETAAPPKEATPEPQTRPAFEPPPAYPGSSL